MENMRNLSWRIERAQSIDITSVLIQWQTLPMYKNGFIQVTWDIGSTVWSNNHEIDLVKSIVKSDKLNFLHSHFLKPTNLQIRHERWCSLELTVSFQHSTRKWRQRKEVKNRYEESEVFKARIGVWPTHANQDESHNIAWYTREQKSNTGWWSFEGETFVKFENDYYRSC